MDPTVSAEVVSSEVKLGSIGGGGRYDDLTSVFGGQELPGVGISFGLDRIYLVIEELDRFPKSVANETQLLFVNFGEAESNQCLKWARSLREAGIRCEVYPESAKMKKQMSYADRKAIPFVALVGNNEIESGQITVKNMSDGEQTSYSLSSLTEKLKG